MQVNFQEGQDVSAGQLLIQIDPRPYEVALAQAEANLQRDEAQLNNAKAQYERNKALYAAASSPSRTSIRCRLRSDSTKARSPATRRPSTAPS